MNTPSLSIQYLGTFLFVLAILHTFFAHALGKLAQKFPADSVKHKTLELLGEVEIVFGFWAGLFVFFIALSHGMDQAISFLENQNFTEPAYVFAIMAVAATRSIRELASQGINTLAHWIHRLFPRISLNQSFYWVALTLGPLLGSLITEPAAMTVTALILRDRYFNEKTSKTFKYRTVATLFVNISIGGVLTHFAAPPVVMVASKWGWDSSFMFFHFGWKALIAVLVNASLCLFTLRKEFKYLSNSASQKKTLSPWGITLVHLFFLSGIIFTSHHMSVFIGLFLLFMGVIKITEPHQDPLQIRESLLVGYFLAGLVVLGSVQAWWLSPFLKSLSELPLYLGATLLTAITDNAALTYLGSQVEGLSETLKYALVAGAVAGGGLTVIANAPNPAGYGILKQSFQPNSLSVPKLFLAATVPTLIALSCFWFF